MKSITINEAVDILNDLLKTDKDITEYLFKQRVSCDEKDTVENSRYIFALQKDGKYSTSILGLFNAIFGDEQYRIAAEWSDERKELLRFLIFDIKEWEKENNEIKNNE